jgi:hypothetical protein
MLLKPQSRQTSPCVRACCSPSPSGRHGCLPPGHCQRSPAARGLGFLGFPSCGSRRKRDNALPFSEESHLGMSTEYEELLGIGSQTLQRTRNTLADGTSAHWLLPPTPPRPVSARCCGAQSVDGPMGASGRPRALEQFLDLGRRPVGRFLYSVLLHALASGKEQLCSFPRCRLRVCLQATAHAFRCVLLSA